MLDSYLCPKYIKFVKLITSITLSLFAYFSATLLKYEGVNIKLNAQVRPQMPWRNKT